MLALAGGGAIWWFLRDKDPGTPVAPVIPLERYEAQRPLMGTAVRIVVYAPTQPLATEAMDAAFERATEIATICTDYDPESELSLLSEAPIREPIPLSPTLAAVLAYAQDTAHNTTGLFDPTLGPLTRLWRESTHTRVLPGEGARQAAREASGWEHMKLDLEGGTLTLTRPGMRFDLGGIAKGYAADEMLRVLEGKGLRSALVALGGDIRLGAPPPDASGWVVGIRALGPQVTELVTVANCGVSTSGDLYQYVEIDGTRYCHILNPATGLGLTKRIAATVIAPTTTQTDPLATFACVSPEAALQAFAAGEISCRIVTLENGVPRTRASANFPRVDAH